jgi:cellulose biosynthesis protein BcsQ
VSDGQSPVSPGKDVRALFEKAKMGESRYRTFSEHKTANAEARPVPQESREEARPTAPVTSGHSPRHALNALFAPSAGLRIAVSRTETPAAQRASFVFASVAGGVGKTTLCATAARILSSRSNNVLVADRCIDGILPFYFSSDRLKKGGLHVVYPHARRPGYPMTLVNVPCEEQVDTSTLAWFEQLQKETTLTLLDYPASNSRSLQNYAVPMGRVVIPLAPDVQSVASLAACEELFGPGALGLSSRTSFVLNRFDEKRPLHREIRSQLEKTLESRLAPVALRESEAVADALALGMTVVDHVPQAPVTKDFEQFVTWLELRLADKVEETEIA